jgi:outer membrane protein
MVPALRAAPASETAGVVGVHLSDYLREVLEHNDALQAQMLDAEAGRRKHRAEYGIFEPELTSSFLREINKRTNNTIQAAQQSGELFFSERNNIYDTGLQTLVPTGAKIRLGYSVSDLINNVNPFGSFLTTTNNSFIQQYQTFAGVTLTQPLLKNGGPGVVLATLRLAALDSDISFQEYRRQLMLTLSQAESAYWNLYYAQEQLRFYQESVALAASILHDSQEKLKAGQGSELEVLEAQSGLALRKTRQNEALQGFYDATSQMRAFVGRSPESPTPALRALDTPVATNVPLTYARAFQLVFDLNPDYLIQLKKVDEERVRLGVARNQVLPELNLKGAYGVNGLGRTPGDSWNVAESGDFPSWTLGIELIVPLGGNIKGRNQLAAAKLTYQEAIANLRNVENQIANGLQASIQRARTWRDSIQSYETVVEFNVHLLATQRERLHVGKIEPRKVLEVEADLLDSRQSLAQALVQFQRAMLQTEVIGGGLLRNRGLDVSRDDLRCKTLGMLHRQEFPTGAYAPILNPPAPPKPN